MNTGSSTTASQVNTVLQTNNSAYYPTFVSANNTTATGMSLYTTSSFVVNPSSGNVGIGIGTPTSLLHVNGTVNITGITTVTNTAVSNGTNSGALQVVGGVGIGGSLNVGSTIVGGGVRSTTTSTAPTSPTVGDIWYITTTDIIARYTSDGISSFWLDISGPTVKGY